MSDPKRILAVVAVLAVTGVAGYTWWQRNDLSADAAFAVYGDEVSVDELEDQSRALTALYGIQKPTDDEGLAKYWSDLAKSTALGRVVQYEADKRAIVVTDRSADEALGRYISRYYGEGADGLSAFTQALGTVGSSRPAVLEEIRRQLEISELFDDVTESVPEASDSDVEAAYAQRRCLIAVPESRAISNIVTTTRAEAAAALALVRSGRSFASAAREFSQDQSTLGDGGALGNVTRDQLEPSYAGVAFHARIGEPFGPVQTRFGWNVGLVTAVTAPSVPSLSKVGTELRQVLTMEARSREWRDWLARRLEAADVRYADEFRPSDPLTLPEGSDPTQAQDQPDVCAENAP